MVSPVITDLNFSLIKASSWPPSSLCLSFRALIIIIKYKSDQGLYFKKPLEEVLEYWDK